MAKFEDFDPNDYTQTFGLPIPSDRPPRPIYTQWGGLNPLTWHTYQVVTNPTKFVLVEYATRTVKIEGEQAYLFLQTVGDDRMDLFKQDSPEPTD